MAGAPNSAGIIASNAGYSGTPLWKLKQMGQVPKFNQEEEKQELDAIALAEAAAAAELGVAVDAVSFGRGDDKPLVRHVIVKDLRKVAARSRVALPSEGIFAGRVPVMLFALFDGQSCAESPGPLCVEWCAKNMLPKLLRNLSALPPGYENDTFVKATLLKTFEDLDKEILRNQPAIHDGCGAAAGLLVGEKLFSAVCGKCDAVLCESSLPMSLGENQGRCSIHGEQKFLMENGGVVFQSEGGNVLVSSPSGAVAAVSRSLGDRAWKGTEGGITSDNKLLRAKPETRVMDISWGNKHVFFALVSAPVSESISPQQVCEIGNEFPQKPRAASGELAGKAAEANQNVQCTAVMVYFLPKEDKAAQQPQAKKLKKEAESVRLRHILVRHRDCGQPFDPVRNQPVLRTREEAEALLRRGLRELAREAKTLKLPVDAAKAKTAALQPTPRYISLCKEMSECTTAQKGGGMLGDLGWLGPDQLQRFGPAFSETAKALAVGQWSDLTGSEHGVHVLQRIA